MRQNTSATDKVLATARALSHVREGATAFGEFTWWATRNGVIVPGSYSRFKNKIVDEGLDYILTSGLVTPSLYLGLTGATPVAAAGDTMASHAGWAEEQGYDEATRQAWTEAGASGGVITNSASPAQFTIDNTDPTVGGLFLTTDNTKGGSGGTLISIAADSDKNRYDGDVINAVWQLTFTSST